MKARAEGLWKRRRRFRAPPRRPDRLHPARRLYVRGNIDFRDCPQNLMNVLLQNSIIGIIACSPA